MNLRPVRIAFTIAALSLSAGAASCGLVGCSRLESFEEVNVVGLPELDYCEIRNDPGRYDGKIVRIRAKVSSFMHGSYLYDERCGMKTYENLLDDHRTDVSFYQPKMDELDASFDRIINQETPWKAVNVVAVGRFTREYPTGGTDIISDRTSFHFELYSIAPANWLAK